MRNKLNAPLGLIAVAALFGVASSGDEAAYEAQLIDMHTAWAEIAGRGACGSGGVLAILPEGHACLYDRPDARTIVEPLDDYPPRALLAMERHFTAAHREAP
ncbi:hypothetical protein FOZ76_14600 [Verticiella sediminum]|uniref:Uncharacterized protein n=1 Tax=Verticiella sediminum TaxID=1247510 RepID=A0A556AIE2_9BURK|nr:hypothetical protein [Verticiella sediminum]TSH92647.1 hypothetical protein FOZ76_14600 [Verticiella sediminum]